MLHGTDNERLRRLGLTELSTHGLLKDHPKAWVLALLRRMITAGLVDLSTGEFPIPYLTPLGIATMKSEEPVRVLVPPPDAGQPRAQKTERQSLGAGASGQRRLLTLREPARDSARSRSSQRCSGVRRLPRPYAS